MSRCLGIAAICVLLATTACRAQQDTAVTPPVAQSGAALTSADITAVIGSDAAARSVIAQVLADTGYQRSTAVLASQVRQEWLPVMSDADFLRLPDSEIRGFLSGCGRYWIITDLQRTENFVTLRLELKCGCTARDYTASFERDLWRVQSNGVGCGCGGSRPVDCPCFGR